MILLRGTWIILKFVKDKNNLYPNAFYYAGDCLPIPQNQLLIKGPITIEPSDEWCSNGKYSFKITTTGTTSDWLRFKYDLLETDVNKTCTLSMKIFSNMSGTVYLDFFDKNNTVLIDKRVQFPANTETTASFSESIPDTSSRVSLTINFNQGINAIRYVDELTLNIQ